MTNYTQEEKIDYIFKELKSQKRGRIFKWLFRIIILFLLFFAYKNFIEWLNREELIENAASGIWEIVQPITENILKNIMDWQKIDTWNINSQITPELIDELKKILQK